MKKMITLALALMLVFTLAACGNETDTNPTESNDTPTTQQPSEISAETTVSVSGGITANTEIENKVDLALDKSTYMVGEHIAVTLDFSKLNQDTAVIVVTNSDTEHGKAIPYDDNTTWVEYRWLSDFSEVPLYLYPQNAGNGLYDVRVYANAESDEELASITVAVGNAVLPTSAE